MIVKVTNMEKMPKSCGECEDYECTLPLKKNRIDVLKAYQSRRHQSCKLTEVVRIDKNDRKKVEEVK